MSPWNRIMLDICLRAAFQANSESASRLLYKTPSKLVVWRTLQRHNEWIPFSAEYRVIARRLESVPKVIHRDTAEYRPLSITLLRLAETFIINCTSYINNWIRIFRNIFHWYYKIICDKSSVQTNPVWEVFFVKKCIRNSYCIGGGR